MRVTQIITGLNPAGAERIVCDLSRGLLSMGHDVSVISLMKPPEGSPIVTELQQAGIAVTSLNLQKTSPWRLLRLPRILRDESPDIVHAHMFHANLASRIQAGSANYAIVNTVHLVEPRWRKRWLLWIDRITRSRCDQYTAVSAGVERFHSRVVGLSRDKITVVHNGIIPPTPLTAAEIHELRRDWGVENCEFVLGSVGRMVHQKGFDTLLRVVPRVLPRDMKAGLVILGDGPERSEIERLAGRVPPGISVSLPGFRADAARCLGAFDALVVPSRYEGFGLVMVEAMAHGIPILASRIDPLVEVGHGYDGVRFADFSRPDEDGIRKGLQELMIPRQRTPSTPFTTGKMVTGYVGVYQSLLGTRSRRG